LISADFITEEAQNALLKVFEEPTAGTHFFVVSPQDILLSTLRSRVQTIYFNGLHSKTRSSVLGLGLKERLEKVKEIAEAIKDSNSSSHDSDDPRTTKQDAIDFLNAIETELYEKLDHTEKFTRSNIVQSLKVCEEARQALYDRGAPVKMILENIVLSI